MEKFVIYRTHYNEVKGWIRNIGETPPSKVVEDYQKRLRSFGHPDGITWKLFEGDLIGAMVESKSI